MATERYGFFNGSTEYTQEDFFGFYGASFRSGIAINDDGTLGYKVTAGANCVTVAPGYCGLNGGFNKLAAVKTITIPTPTNYARVDRIVCSLDKEANTIEVIRLAGTESSNPTAPEITRDNVRYMLSFAKVAVNTSGIITVTDERYNSTLCGTLRPKLDTEFNGALELCQERFDEYMRETEGKESTGRQVFIQSVEPTTPKDGSIYANIDANKGVQSVAVRNGTNWDDLHFGGSLVSELFLAMHPVGSYYWSSNKTSPAVLFGGTWENVKNRMVYAVDPYSKEAGKTGGQESVTLETNELPAHSHDCNHINAPTGTRLTWYEGNYTMTSGGAVKFGALYNENNTVLYTGNTGENKAHDNMPPYITAYCWHRTA